MFKSPASIRFRGVLRSSRGTIKQFIGRPKLVADGVNDRIEGRVLRLISTTRPKLRLVATPLPRGEAGK